MLVYIIRLYISPRAAQFTGNVMIRDRCVECDSEVERREDWQCIVLHLHEVNKCLKVEATSMS